MAVREEAGSRRRLRLGRAPRLRLADRALHRPQPAGDGAEHLGRTTCSASRRTWPTIPPRSRRRAPGPRPLSLATVPVGRERRCERVSCARSRSAAAALALLIGRLAAGFTMATNTSPPRARRTRPTARRRSPDGEHSDPAPRARDDRRPAPRLPLVALCQRRRRAHEVFGYAPYWSLPQASQFPVDDFSTIAYFGVDVNPNGTIEMSGPGWNGYESQDFTDLVNAAHQAGDRVVLDRDRLLALVARRAHPRSERWCDAGRAADGAGEGRRTSTG